MSDSIWQEISYLNLLWLLIPLALLFLVAARRRKRLLKHFANQAQWKRMTQSVNTPARVIQAILLTLALVFAIIALARPAWNKSKQPFKAKGRDVVFVLDISRSMLAQHRNTTRLEEAKFAIQECLSTIKGDRIALVIFAGNAKIACPLTHDYAYFLAKLNDVDYRSVTFGGTMLGDAIRLVCNGIFKNKAQLYRDVIVITDGEDMQSNPIQAAERLAELDARLIAAGMGDTTPHPLVITTPDGKAETLTENGKTVMTKLDGDTLMKMAESTSGGVFIPVHSDMTLNLNQIYQNLIRTQLKQDFEDHEIVVYEEKFQIFLLISIVLLAISRLLPLRRSLPTPLAAWLLGLFLLVPSAQAEETSKTEPDQLVREAYEMIQLDQLDQAEEKLQQAVKQVPEHPLALFNLGTINYRRKNYQQALKDFQKAQQAVQHAKQEEFLEQDSKKLKEITHLATGNAAYELSRQQPSKGQQTTPDQVLEQQINLAKQAVSQFQQALNENPQNKIAKENLKSAKLNHKKLVYTKKQLQKQQQKQQAGNQKNQKKQDKQQQQQNQQQQNQQQQNQQQQNQQQQNQQQDLEKLEQQQRQAAKDLQEQQKSQQELQKQQQELQKQAQQQLDKQQQKQQQEPSSSQQKKAEDFLKEAHNQQQQAQQELDNKNREKAQEHQKQAADLTRMARKTLQEKPEQKPQQPPKDQQKPQPEKPMPEPKTDAQAAPKEQPMDARSMDAINQEQINKQQRKKFHFAPPARMNRDW